VAMSNLYTDPDSLQIRRAQAASLFDSTTLEFFTDDALPGLLGSVLHEAAHNLGPAHEYAVRGKKDHEVFGGPLSTMLEELKAQTAALYFTSWLLGRKLIDQALADRTHVTDLVWALAQLSRGTYTPTGRPRAYPQLAAIQLGYFMKQGALQWRATELAGNGKDRGCLAVDLAKLPPHIATLMEQVARIKARGDKAAAQALVAEFVDVTGDAKALRETIAERWRRAPKQTFVYSIER